MWYTLAQLQQGEGFFVAGHICVYQRGSEDVFVTDGKDSVPNTAEGWHLAGGGRLLADGTPRIDWCDLR